MSLRPQEIESESQLVFSDITEEDDNSNSNNNRTRRCIFVLTRGPRRGSQCRDRVNNRNIYCLRHNEMIRRNRNRERQNNRTSSVRGNQRRSNLRNLGRPRRVIQRPIRIPSLTTSSLDTLSNLVNDMPLLESTTSLSTIVPRLLPSSVQVSGFTFPSVSSFSFVSNAEEIEEIKEDEILYETCVLCNHKSEFPKVILECDHEIHLNCYKMIENETKCVRCDDIIFKSDKDYKKCSICLEKMKIKREKFTSKCSHNFHKTCITQWIKMNKDTCPLCRSKL